MIASLIFVIIADIYCSFNGYRYR